MPAPKKAKSGLSPAYYEEEEEDTDDLCDQCALPFDDGTYISIETVEDGTSEEVLYLCSRECLVDLIEKEIVDNRVDRAVHRERNVLHSCICPACKRRVHQRMTEGIG